MILLLIETFRRSTRRSTGGSKMRVGRIVVLSLMITGCGRRGDDGRCLSAGCGGARSDPYAVYLANNPEPSLVLSADDAQARAMLGCDQNWAPGTIDAVLHDAYKSLC